MPRTRLIRPCGVQRWEKEQEEQVMKNTHAVGAGGTAQHSGFRRPNILPSASFLLTRFFLRKATQEMSQCGFTGQSSEAFSYQQNQRSEKKSLRPVTGLRKCGHRSGLGCSKSSRTLAEPVPAGRNPIHSYTTFDAMLFHWESLEKAKVPRWMAPWTRASAG